MQSSTVRVNWRIVGITAGVVVGFWIINKLSDTVHSPSVHHVHEHTTDKHKQDHDINHLGKIFVSSNGDTWLLQAKVLIRVLTLN